MEKNNLHKAYIYILAIFAIGVSIANIIAFFNGVGFALVGASTLLILTVLHIVKNERIKKRFGDIFVLLMFEFLMISILFVVYDFGIDGISSGFLHIMRNICAIYSLLSVCYVLFRYVGEVKGVKYGFVEYMLGNYTSQPKQPKEKKIKPSKAEIKKNKELENGTLEPKPSSLELVAINNYSEKENLVIEESEDDIEDDYVKMTDKEDNAQTDNETNQSTNLNISNRTNFWY